MSYYDRFKQALTDVVEQRGSDYVYPTERRADESIGGVCYYVWESEGDDGEVELDPGCIIGAALFHLGVISLTKLQSYEGRPGGNVVIGALDGIANSGNVRDYARVRDLANKAQRYQDEGKSWGEALARAIQEVESASYGPAGSVAYPFPN